MPVTDLDPLSPVQVDTDMRNLAGELVKLTNQIMQAEKDAAEADSEWRKAKAMAKRKYEECEADAWLDLQREGFKGIKEEKAAEVSRRCRDQHYAQIEAEHGDLYRAKRTKEAFVHAIGSSSENIRTAISVLQTISKNIRATVTHAYGEGG